MKVYHIDIAVNDVTIANAYGNAGVVSYVAKDSVAALKASGEKASVTLTEVEHIGGDTVDTLMDVTADAKSVSFLLRKSLAEIRKAEKGEDATPEIRKAGDATAEVSDGREAQNDNDTDTGHADGTYSV